jgi:hypothetical protein
MFFFYNIEMSQPTLLPLNKKRYRFAFLKSSIAVFKWTLFRIKPQTHTFLQHKGLSLAKGNEVLNKMLRQSEPFAAVRIGAVEMGALHNYEKILLGIKKTFKPIVRYSMKNNAGFFPTDDKHLIFYAKHFMKDAKKTDVFGISGIHMEAYIFQRYFGTQQVIPYEAFEPLRGDWIHQLAGKKVLVVSPFAEDIERQYAKRKKLFPQGVLPEFTLITVKAVQTIGEATDSRYATWFDALDAMKVAIMKHDFDVALIGAGAYGSPLCWFVKTMGKQAIQTGGATQTLFGIIGRRWEQRAHVSRYLNKYWIRPTQKPKGAEKVEHGAYW